MIDWLASIFIGKISSKNLYIDIMSCLLGHYRYRKSIACDGEKDFKGWREGRRASTYNITKKEISL